MSLSLIRKQVKQLKETGNIEIINDFVGNKKYKQKVIRIDGQNYQWNPQNPSKITQTLISKKYNDPNLNVLGDVVGTEVEEEPKNKKMTKSERLDRREKVKKSKHI